MVDKLQKNNYEVREQVKYKELQPKITGAIDKHENHFIVNFKQKRCVPTKTES